MIALDVANKQVIDWKHHERRSIQIPEDMLLEMLVHPENQHEIVKLNYEKPHDTNFYEESIKFYYGCTSVYIRPNEDGSIAKIAFERVIEKHDGTKLSKDEDMLLCNYSLLSAGFFLLEEEYYNSGDDAKISFIIEGMAKLWREIKHAKVTE